MDEIKKAERHILYISYDGLTDPLGQSQILPYVQGLEQFGYRFTILSFEKEAPFAKNQAHIRELISGKNINWMPLAFTKNPPLLSKFYDAIRMKTKAYALHRSNKFDMVHCRSYIAADVGLSMKRKFGIRFFFDMRGFWADEKKDGGSWNINNPLFKAVYRYYKSKESKYIQHADYIISLTDAGKKELSSWEHYKKEVPIRVIPCCADMNHFSLTDHLQKSKSREQLNLPMDVLILSYLGSVGTWYMLDEMLILFKEVLKSYPNAQFLFVTHSDAEIILKSAAAHQIDPALIVIKEASRNQVPVFIKASDINVSFIKPVYSKISSSPTKLGEVLSMGIPVICNSKVGDVKAIVDAADAGIVIDDFSAASFQNVVQHIPTLLSKSPIAIRDRVKDIYSLEKGVGYYLDCYKQVFNE